jgi:hypothetical protein
VAVTYDEGLAERIRLVLRGEPGLTERRMFGGLAFMLDGHMALGASGSGGLMLRVDPAQADALLDEPGARRFEMRRRELRGWLHVDADAVRDDDVLRAWAGHAVTWVRSLPPKPGAP